jgi:hypothetical protein
MTVIFLVTLIVVQRLQTTIYFTSLIKSFYRFQPENKLKGELHTRTSTRRLAAIQ